MRAKFEEARERLRGLWGTLEAWQKVSLVGASIAVLGGILLLVFMAGRTSYEPLFANLHMTDQAAVVAYLKEQKIPFKVDPSFSAILVPRDNVYEARIALAGRGIPNNGTTGYELLDTSRVGATDFQQRVALNRALEGELARTIQWINAVETARVTIVIPETRLFLEQQMPSTASVMLRIAPGREIGQEEVKAIVHLVASSIEGLKPENVTIVDTDGQNLTDLVSDGSLLFTDSGGGSGGRRDVTSVQRRLEQQQEREFEQKLRTLLERVYGPGRAKVAVRVQLDFDKRSNNQRTYIPLPDTRAGVIRSTQNTEESFTGPANFPGGVPGTTTNIPGYVANTGQGSGNAEYNRADTITNYDITTHESQQVETPGKVKRLSASVIIDGNLSADVVAKWKDTVANAIGFDEARGDRLTVVGMPFDTSVEDAMLARLDVEKQRQLIMVGVSALFLVILAGALLFIWLRRRRAAALLREKQSPAGADQVPSLRELLDNPDLMTSQGELSVLEEQLRNYAMNNPEEMANLIKNWIVED